MSTNCARNLRPVRGSKLETWFLFPFFSPFSQNWICRGAKCKRTFLRYMGDFSSAAGCLELCKGRAQCYYWVWKQKNINNPPSHIKRSGTMRRLENTHGSACWSRSRETALLPSTMTTLWAGLVSAKDKVRHFFLSRMVVLSDGVVLVPIIATTLKTKRPDVFQK